MSPATRASLTSASLSSKLWSEDRARSSIDHFLGPDDVVCTSAYIVAEQESSI